MKRKLLQKLIKWKDSLSRKPLILEGARQIGKTYLIEKEFGPAYFSNLVKINFEDPSSRPIADLFSRTYTPSDIITGIEGNLGVKITPGETLLFFDEVQACPHAIAALRYFYEQAPEYHIIAAGSLLGVYLSKVTDHDVSYPVGRVDTLRLEPMDFEEFLWACGREEATTLLHRSPADPILDLQLADFLRQYQIVGGMPEAVKSWLEFHDYERVDEIHSKILADYRNDFIKYTDKTTATRLSEIFDSLPEQFAKEGDKFHYGLIKPGARGREYENAIAWLVNAGIVRRVFRTERGDKYPLSAYRMLDSFKLYFLDIGLFRRLAWISPQVILEKNAIFNEYNGVFAEQFVLQNLSVLQLDTSFIAPTICYWAGDRAEVDFVVQDTPSPRIVPIEVKSGENVQAKSLRSFRDKYQPALAVRISLLGYDYNNGLLNLPMYKIFTLPDLLSAKLDELA